MTSQRQHAFLCSRSPRLSIVIQPAIAWRMPQKVHEVDALTFLCDAVKLPRLETGESHAAGVFLMQRPSFARSLVLAWHLSFSTCQQWSCWWTEAGHTGGVPEHCLSSTAMVRLNRRSIRLIPHISLPIHPINKDPALPLLQSVLGRYEGGVGAVSAAYVRAHTP